MTAPRSERAIDADALHSPVPRRGPRSRVLIIGAGLAGLVAAFELEAQGHDPLVLEAQNRVGGRVLTLRSSFAPGLYAEAGAMRIPRVHELTLAYCRRLGLELRPFVTDCPRAPMYLAGRRVTFADVAQDPASLPLQLAVHERGRTLEELWDGATSAVRKRYQRAGEPALDALRHEFDGYSIRSFLSERGFSEDALELYGLMSFRESNMSASVVEQLREIVGRVFEDMQEVVGGMDRLPAALFARLGRHVRLGARVFAVEQEAHSVTVHYRLPGGGTASASGDHCICTVPFGVLRHIDFRPALSRGKYRAIRELNYNPSTKIMLQVRTRFWERQGIVGGTTVTDLPIRRIVYPSHPPPGDEPRGVLLASYTWGQDAARWGALSPGERIELAIRDVAKIHPEIVNECEGGASYCWYDDPFAVGAFALFQPGQETALHPHIVRPEGRVHFAGEHCSLWHAWIQGALESGVRAARAVHDATRIAL